MMVRFGHSYILCNEKLHDALGREHEEGTTRRTRSPASRKSVARMESKLISRNIKPHSKKLYLV